MQRRGGARTRMEDMKLESMGAFILALRKSAGMTQQDLAQQVGVTNKSVSRWENGECAPDLTLIPVLADLFGVSADELLRGERRAPGEREEPDAAREKRIGVLASAVVSGYGRTVVLTGAAPLLGLVALLALAYGARLPLLGVGVCALFALSGAVVAVERAMRALCALSGGEIESAAVLDGRRRVIHLAAFPCTLSVCAIALSVPYLLPDLYTEYQNAVLELTSWLKLAPLCLASAGVLCAAASAILYARLAKGRPVELGEAGRASSRAIAAALGEVAALCAIALPLCLTLSPLMGPKGTVYDDFESFRALMETPVNCTESHIVFSAEGERTVYGDVAYLEGVGGERQYYYHANMDVERVEASPSRDGLPVTVYTRQQLAADSSAYPLLYLWPSICALAYLVAALLLRRRGRQTGAYTSANRQRIRP